MNKLRLLRGEKTQKEIADKVGITTSHYGFIENGDRLPSLKVAKRIADYFGTQIEDIFFDETYNKMLGEEKLDETG